MGTDQTDEQRDGSASAESARLKAAAPTRRTLVFPAVEVARWRPRPRGTPARDSERASERPTLKTLPPVLDEPSSGHGNTEVIELSASALESDASLVELERARPSGVKARRWWSVARRLLVALPVVGVIAVSPGVVATVGERATGVSDGLAARGREAHVSASEHTSLAMRPTSTAVRPRPGSCGLLGAPRVLSTRAHLPPGLDVSVARGGFGVGFASSSEEARGLRLRVDDLPLRVEDRVRVRGRAGSARMTHVAVARPATTTRGEDDEDELDLRMEADLAVVGGFIQARPASAGGVARTLWPVPGAKARGTGRAAAEGDTRAADLRAAARDDGGAVVVLRIASALWLGLVDADRAAHGPLAPLPRRGAMLGKPSIAPVEGGGVVAWAERPAGDREWIVMVASFSAAGAGGGAGAPVVRPIAAGMSPSISALPGGDVLLAYAIGAAGEHRVVVRRLGRDLEVRGEAVAVSPEAVNAGQPATAALGDGRALVAFFGAERGHPPRVLATPLSCSLEL